ncbi:hypothetical protein GCM10022270_10910 [Terriglobus aquaticus]
MPGLGLFHKQRGEVQTCKFGAGPADHGFGCLVGKRDVTGGAEDKDAAGDAAQKGLAAEEQQVIVLFRAGWTRVCW